MASVFLRDFIDPNTPTAPPLHSLTFPMYGKPDTGLISTPSRKRARCSVYDESPARLFDQEMIISHIEHQRSEIDRFIAIHVNPSFLNKTHLIFVKKLESDLFGFTDGEGDDGNGGKKTEAIENVGERH